jgi:hypothetical protein
MRGDRRSSLLLACDHLISPLEAEKSRESREASGPLIESSFESDVSVLVGLSLAGVVITRIPPGVEDLSGVLSKNRPLQWMDFQVKRPAQLRTPNTG